MFHEFTCQYPAIGHQLRHFSARHVFEKDLLQPPGCDIWFLDVSRHPPLCTQKRLGQTWSNYRIHHDRRLEPPAWRWCDRAIDVHRTPACPASRHADPRLHPGLQHAAHEVQ